MGTFNRLKAFILLLPLITCLFFAEPSHAFDNPELLPENPTPVIDLARTLSKDQKLNLEKSLETYEQETGWKIRVLSQFEQTPGLSVKKFWDLDESSLLLVADPRGGNLLNFNVGDAYFALMPRLFWVELQTRFGNQFYVRDHGEDGAILDAINAVTTCLDRGGCQVVPGLPKEQLVWTLMSSLLGGFISGVAAFPRKDGELISWGWLLLLSPLWIMLFGVFGIAPIITRTNEILPLFRNSIGFITTSIIGYLIAQLISKKSNAEDE